MIIINEIIITDELSGRNCGRRPRKNQVSTGCELDGGRVPLATELGGEANFLL